MKLKKIFCVFTSAALMLCSMIPLGSSADDSMAHDPSRNVQEEGVGNPFNYGERNTPANASTAEIRAINHKMTVQEVKYALYKEIDEHWDLLKVRLGQPDREKVYALFLGLGTRESTLGGNGDGADIETAFSEGFGVSSAHAYGTMQTAVTAFADCNPTFMKEDNVPEMFQYSLSESNFYDAIISNHMGIRKILHFVEIGINQEGLEGFRVVQGALKGFNTGWCDYTPDNQGYYKDYPDEIAALAHWYYDEHHLYDNTFTWTNAPVADQYRNNAWDWWSDVKPSMAEVGASEPAATSTTTTVSETTATTTSETQPVQNVRYGDSNCDGEVNLSDAVLIMQSLANPSKYGISGYDSGKITAQGLINADCSNVGDGVTNADALAIQKYSLNLIGSLPV